MPDLGFVILLLLVAATAAAFVGWPLFGRHAAADAVEADPSADDAATLTLRHRLALEALRDVEADYRAGSLDATSYADLRAEAEERAATTLAELEDGRAAGPPPRAVTRPVRAGSRRLALLAGGGLALLMAAGILLPGPLSLANGTVVDQQLASAQAAESQRQAEIAQLRGQLASHPNDAATLVRLANLYLAGGTPSDQQTAAQLLIFAIQLEPQRADAYRLLVTAYISASDYPDAEAATDSLAKIAPGAADVPFFRGLIALQGKNDRSDAVRWFDAFLASAPDDPRAAMVRSLRAQAAGQVP